MAARGGTRRKRELRPAFIVIAAGALTACPSARDSDSLNPIPTAPITEPPPFAFCDGCSSENPPAPAPRFEPPRPNFGATVTQAKAPPALGAATLVIAADGKTAVISDPDRDRVLVVDLVSPAHPIHDVTLVEDDEPGRLVVDNQAHAHVVLRRAGAVASIDTATGTVRERRAVCATPQGIAVHGSTLYVTCVGGEIVTLPTAAGGAAALVARVDRDLRDVVVHFDADGPSLLVSRLRSAEVLRVRVSDGEVTSRAIPPTTTRFGGSLDDLASPFVGYRLVATPSGALLSHQLARTSVVQVEQSPELPAPYAGANPCDGLVTTTVSTFRTTTANVMTAKFGALIPHGVVPIDLALSSDGEHVALIAAGNAHTQGLPQIHLMATVLVQSPPPVHCLEEPVPANPPGQAVAVAFTPDNATIAVFTREPAALHLMSLEAAQHPASAWTTIALGGPSREDTGHAVFHSNTGGGIACVSCHPSGADDGRIWRFSTGDRRTQSLQGTLDGTAPYHWSGDVPGIETFATDVFVKRMGGQGLATEQVDALRSWLVHIPAPPVSAAADTAASARGKTLFESQSVGCNGCHSGPKHTNSTSADVGTGGVFQVPSLLGLSTRAPYLHDGRAATLADRFGAGSTDGSHGNTAGLSSTQLQDLITYLDTL
jgi:hypothetical protein